MADTVGFSALDRLSMALAAVASGELLAEAREIVAELQRTPALSHLARGLLVLFCFLVAIHLILATGAVFDAEPFETLWRDGAWRLDVDHSIPEHLEYLLLLAAAAAMAWCWQRTRAPVYAALALASAFMLVNGYFQVHEQAGRWMNLSSSWRGELVYFAGVGAGLGTLVLLALRRSPREHRRAGALCLGTLVGIAGCGVGLDAAHSIAKFSQASNYLQQGLAFAEDGGELAFIMLNLLVNLAVAGHMASISAKAARGG
jgi:hypothetical protein